MSSKAGLRAQRKRQKRQSRRASVVGLLAVGTAGPLGAAVVTAPPADAAAFSVTNLNDSGAGSLRAAVAAANASVGADTITFGTTGVIQLTSGEIEVTDDVTVTGPGADQLTINGGGQSRVFNIHPGAPANAEAVVITGLTLANGSAPSQYSSYYHTNVQQAGGAVYVAGYYNGGHGSLSMNDVTIVDSHAGFGGGAIAARRSDVHLTNVSMSNNSADGAGSEGGALTLESGVLTISHSTIQGNHALSGGGLRATIAQVQIEDSVISGNTADAGGGGLLINNLYDGVNSIRNSEITSNSAQYNGGGGYIGGGDYIGGPVEFENVTIVGNNATGEGGGLRIAANVTLTGATIAANSAAHGGGIFSSPDNVAVRNSIVADNAGSSAADNDIAIGHSPYDGPVLLDYSLVESTPAAGAVADVTAGSNIIGQDPQLDTLADNGGPTRTKLPLATSPVIDKGKSFGLTTDQRANSRPVDLGAFANAAGGDGADMGAVELATAVASPVENTGLPTIGGGPAVGVTLTQTSPGSWTPGGLTLTRQWLRNGAVIPGATGTAYTLGAGDLGTRISLRVTASRSGYIPATATSAQSAAVAKGSFALTGTPVIRGKLRVGKTLTAVPPGCRPAATVQYRWLRNGKAITGATGVRYKLRRADKGKHVSVRVTFTRAAYNNKVVNITRAGKVKG